MKTSLKLLDDVSPTWRTLFDVFGGAIKMQLKVWGPLKIVAACAAVGVVASMGYSLMIPSHYISRAILKTDDAGRTRGAVVAVEGRASLTRIIVDEGLYQSQRTKEPLEDIIERMKTNDIRVHELGSPAFSVSFVATDPEVARRVTNRLAAAFVDAKGGELVDPASPGMDGGPRRSRAFWMGLALGAFAGALFALFNGLKVWKLAVAMAAAGAALSAGIAFAIPDQYWSTAVVVCKSADAIKPINDAAFSDVIRRFGLYPNDANALRKLKQHLRVVPIVGAGPRAIAVAFRYPDRYVAQKVTQELAARLIDGNSGVRMLDPASLPLQPSFPNRVSISFVGLLAGLFCAILLGVWRRWRGLHPLAA